MILVASDNGRNPVVLFITLRVVLLHQGEMQIIAARATDAPETGMRFAELAAQTSFDCWLCSGRMEAGKAHAVCRLRAYLRGLDVALARHTVMLAAKAQRRQWEWHAGVRLALLKSGLPLSDDLARRYVCEQSD